MATVEMRILFPEVAGGRLTGIELSNNYILAKFEIDEVKESKITFNHESKDRIDVMALEGEWRKHTPVTHNPKDFLDLYQGAGGELTSIAVGDDYILAKFEIERNKEEAESSSTISRNESGYSINPENFEEALLKNTPAMQNQKEQPEEMCFQGI